MGFLPRRGGGRWRIRLVVLFVLLWMFLHRTVAVALRNQKVKIPNGSGQIAEVINSVSIPALNELTICFEVEKTGSGQKEWLFTYFDINNNVALSFGNNQTGMEMVIDGVVCSVESIISVAEFTSSMKFFCVLWMSSNSRVAVYFNRRYYGKTCSPSSGHSVPAGGVFKLGGLGPQSFKGNMYNLRLWNRAMTVQELNSLTCDMVGNIIDWDNSQWSISSSLAQTDNTLSCICYPHCIHLTAAAPTSGSNPATGCDSGALGCSAASSPTSSSTDSTNTSHDTNAIFHDGLFYWVSFTVETELNLQAVQRAAALWINQTFQNWTHSLDHIRVEPNAALNSYTCQVLLMITNESLGEADVLAQLILDPAGTSQLGRADDIDVRQIGQKPVQLQRMSNWKPWFYIFVEKEEK